MMRIIRGIVKMFYAYEDDDYDLDLDYIID